MCSNRNILSKLCAIPKHYFIEKKNKRQCLQMRPATNRELVGRVDKDQQNWQWQLISKCRSVTFVLSLRLQHHSESFYSQSHALHHNFTSSPPPTGPIRRDYRVVQKKWGHYVWRPRSLHAHIFKMPEQISVIFPLYSDYICWLHIHKIYHTRSGILKMWAC